MIISLLGTIFFGYCALSFVLLRWPTLLHKKKQSKINATIVCHRGGSGEFLENTIHAFDSAVKLHCDVLELDCQLTKDQEVVVCHDKDLLRATGVAKCVTDLNYGELPRYRACLPVTFGFGRECRVKPGVSRSIPLLRTVFEKFPNTPVNVDVKCDSDILIRKIADLIEEFGREDLTVWGSFSDVVNRKCQKANPRIATFMPIKRTIMVLCAYYLGLLPFLPLSDGFFEMPLVCHFGRMPNVVDYIKSWAARIPGPLKFFRSDTEILDLVIRLADNVIMSRKLVDHLRSRGVKVFYWVCNTSEDFDRVFAMGKVGVVTDYPSELVSYLVDHPAVPRGTFSKIL